MDHQTALEAANQALSSGRRSESRISSVELKSVSTPRLYSDVGEGGAPPASATRGVSGEVWQLAGMLVVAVATLSFVVSLWLM